MPELTPAYIEKVLIKALDELGYAVVPKKPTRKQIKAMQAAMPSLGAAYRAALNSVE